MRATFFPATASRILFGVAVVWTGSARADDTTPSTTLVAPWQQEDWLKPADASQKSTAPSETFHATTGQVATDPFAVVSTGMLWQDQRGEVYIRRLDDTLSLSCEANSVSTDGEADLSRSQEVGLQFQPWQAFTFRGDFHDAMTDALLPTDSTTSTGADFSAESHLPGQSVLTVGMRSDRTETDVPSGVESQTNAYDAQFQQPVGSLPLSAVLKGHLEGTSTGNAPATSLPSLEQSLVWKPLQNTTLQAGLRQQQYQEYPGVDHQLNEALFADWSQKVVDNVSWHSYAEVLNSKGLLDQAPVSPIASGANGTAQATSPLANTSVTSSMPLSVDDQTVTFSTGPSFQLEKDISASVEYSDRWDKNPNPGSVGQEQRVSVSLKGTF
jgi:hypothetical protein